MEGKKNGPSNPSQPIMANEQIEVDEEAIALTKNDLKLLEMAIIDKIAVLLKPLQLDNIKTTMAETKKTPAD